MKSNLTVNVRSFSYKEGIPQDESGNGGGFVFDCRGILNPGRIEDYKTQTGRDEAVKMYLENETDMPQFISSAEQIVGISVKDYIQRGFTNLEVNFGCTGGQHRSVYAADHMAQYIIENFPEANVNLSHVVQERKNWVNESY